MKKKIAEFYVTLLYQTLDDAAKKFSSKGLELYLREYTEDFFTKCLFRVPEFRKLVCESIL
jgi:hypothetical protein